MHIAIVTHNVFVGDGQGRVNYELTRHLLRRGVRVTLIADTVAPEVLDWGAEWIRVHPRPFADAIDLVKVVGFRYMASQLLDQIGTEFDAVLACGVVLDRPHTVNAVHFVHGPWLDSPYHPSQTEAGLTGWYQWVYSRLNARWERQTLNQASSVIAVSDKIRSELIDIGTPPEQVQTVVNGVSLDEFHPADVERDSLGLPDGPLALFVGDIRSSRKNLDSVLHALVQVPDLHLAVAGDTTRSPYPALSRELGLADRSHFLGFRRDIPRLMQAADFFVFPSRYEACTLVLLEAMASGLPVITARTAGGAELVGTDSGFVLDDPDDSAGLVSAMTTLANSPDRRRNMGHCARRTAEQCGWEQMADHYLRILEAHVSSPPLVPSLP